MRIHHLALWTRDLEKLKDFYLTYFACRAGKKYHNPHTGFSSYFLTFGEGARLEIMHTRELRSGAGKEPSPGLAHFAVSTGSRETVLALTERLRSDGYRIASEPRTTGDGFYESCVLDPEGNRVEITI